MTVSYIVEQAPSATGPWTAVPGSPFAAPNSTLTGLPPGNVWIGVTAQNTRLGVKATRTVAGPYAVTSQAESAEGLNVTDFVTIIEASKTPGFAAGTSGSSGDPFAGDFSGDFGTGSGPLSGFNTFQLTAGGQIKRNGAVDATTSNVYRLYYHNHTTYYEASINNGAVTPGWWSDNGIGWVPSGSPLPPSVAIAIGAVTGQIAGAAFAVTATLSNYGAAPNLQYQDIIGSVPSGWQALPAAAVVSAGAVSFVNPALAAAPSCLVQLRDLDNQTIIGTSNFFAVSSNAIGVPGLPSLAPRLVGSTSISLSITLPTTGGPIDAGGVQTLYRQNGTLPWVIGPAVAIITPGIGTFTTGGSAVLPVPPPSGTVVNIQPNLAAWTNHTFAANERCSTGGNSYQAIPPGGTSTAAPTGTAASVNNGGACAFMWLSAIDQTSLQAAWNATPTSPTVWTTDYVFENWNNGQVTTTGTTAFLNTDLGGTKLMNGHALLITCAAGESIKDSPGAPLTYNPSIGVAFSSDAAMAFFGIYIDGYTGITLDGLQLRNQATSWTPVSTSTTGSVTVQRCLIDAIPQPADSAYHCYFAGANSNLIESVLIDRRPANGAGECVKWDLAATGKANGCVVVSINGVNVTDGSAFKSLGPAGQVLIRNSSFWGYNNPLLDQNFQSFTADHCATDAPALDNGLGWGIVDGGGNLLSRTAANQFVNIVGAADLRPGVGVDGTGLGFADLINIPSGQDFYGRVRGAVWDIGAIAATFTAPATTTLVWSVTSGGQVAVNGVADLSTSSVTQLILDGTLITQQNAAGNYYTQTSTIGTWGGPVTTSPLASPGVSILTVPGETYNFEAFATNSAGSGQTSVPITVATLFTESSDGDSLTTATGSLIDAAGRVWALVASTGTARPPFQITLNGALQTITQGVTLLRYFKRAANLGVISGSVVQENDQASWYYDASVTGNVAAFTQIAGDPFAAVTVGGTPGTLAVANGRITLNGADFHYKGVNVPDALANSVTPALIKALFPHINAIRYAVGAGIDGPEGFDAAQQSDQTNINWVNAATAAGYAVCVESHFQSGNTNSPTTAQGRYTTFGNAFKTNGMVMYGSYNEVVGDVTGGHVAVYNAVRATGANNLILMCTPAGNPSPPNGPASAYQTMHGIVWEQHLYNWMTSGNTNQGSVNAIVTQMVADRQAYTNSADGVAPVVFNECGFIDYTGNPNVEVNGGNGTNQVVIAGLTIPAASGVGIWLWNGSAFGWPTVSDIVNPSNNTLTQHGVVVVANS